MAQIASLLVKIGGDSSDLSRALAQVGEKAKGLDTDLKRLGNSPIAPQAQKSLESMQQTMGLITKAQQEVANKAASVASGLEAIGGAGKLTDAQLKAVNKTLQEGLSAFQALGQEAPNDLKRVSDEVQQIGKSANGAIGSLKDIGAALGATFTLGVIVNFGKQLLQMGDDIVRVSDRTGLLTEEVQRLNFIASQSGNSLDEITSAIGQMQNRLSSGDNSALAALERLHVNLADLENEGPYQQLQRIATAIKEIESPANRAQAAIDLFGKAGVAILPTLTSDFEGLGKAAPVMADNTVRALDRAGDALNQFQLQVKVWAAESYNFLGKLFDSFSGFILRSTARVFEDVAGLMQQLQKIPGADRLLGLSGGIQSLKERAQFSRDADSALSQISSNVGQPSGKAAAGFNLITDAANKTTEAVSKTNKEAEKFQALQDQLFGNATIAHANELVKAFDATHTLAQVNDRDFQKLRNDLGEAIDVYHRRLQEVPPALQRIYDQLFRIRNISNGLGFAPGAIATSVDLGPLQPSTDLGSSDIQLFPNGNEKPIGQQHIFGPTPLPTKLPLPDLSSIGSSLGDAFSTAIPNAIQAAIQGGGSKLQAAGSALGGVLFGKDSSLTKSITGLFSGDGFLAKTFKDAIPVIGALIGPALEGLGKLFGKIFGTAGRDQVRAFASDQGGFDALHQKLGQLGDDGEKLWVSLTQGVGRNNADEAKAAIAKVTEALDKQKEKLKSISGDITTLGTRLKTITTLSPELAKALDAAMNAKSAEDVSAAIRDINTELDAQDQKFKHITDTLSKYGLSVSEAGKSFKQQASDQAAQTLIDDFQTLKDAGVDVNHEMHAMGDNVRQFIKDAQKSGVEVPRSMQEVIQVAIDAGEVFQNTEGRVTDFADAAKKAGVDIPAAMRDVLKSAVDAGANFGNSGKDIDAFVQAAKKAGIEIPRSMQDVLQSAINAGDLFDKDGKKITDINDLGLTFGDTMEQVMKHTIPDAIASLTTVLEGLAKFLGIVLPGAAEAGAEATQNALDSITAPVLRPTVDLSGIANAPDIPNWDGQQIPEGAATGAVVTSTGLRPIYAAGGFMIPRGTDTIPAMLTPGELVLNAAQQKNVASAVNGGSDAMLAILRNIEAAILSERRTVVQVDGRPLVDSVSRVLENGGAALTRFRTAAGVAS